MTRKGFFVFCVTATIIACVLSVSTRPQGRREIVSDDFTRPRPTPAPRPVRTGGAGIIAPKRPARPPEPTSVPPKLYRFAGSSAPNAPPFSATDNIEQLGLTFWRLRPAGNIETGQPMLIREQDKSTELVPERVEMDTPLRFGDRVRLSIESPREGYLYVVDRDLYADGRLGDALLIFPSHNTPVGNNKVRPGKLIDIPAQEDDPNYFTLRPGRSHQVGRLLTIIVTTTPLDLRIGKLPLPISTADMTKWENLWGSQTERFELEGGAGKPWTKEEKEASAANGSRQLTQNDPSPQTIYRIASTNRTAFLINVRLSYQQ